MFYHQLDESYERKQTDFYTQQNLIRDIPKDLKRYGIPASFDYLNDALYSRLPAQGYAKDTPVTHIFPFRESVPLGRDYMGFGLRGYWIIGDNKTHVSATDRDRWRVDEHENIHANLSQSDPFHPEWLVRLIEDLRLGKENYN